MAGPTAPRDVAVIDIGKTNAKLALVDLETRAEIAAIRRPNQPKPGPSFPEHDVWALWDFVLEGLAALHRGHRVDAISVTTHGATAVLLDAEGVPSMGVLDYEFAIPDRIRERYDAIRPSFEETGSPALPFGLNLGAQLYWLQEKYPGAFERTASILTYPQYWSYKLTGMMASEATSLGCHTDLWDPAKRDFSTLIDVMDWRGRFPPLRPANAVLGPVLRGIAAATGLDPRTPVVNGIHDSNASLLPHLIDRQPPFSVVSTGTWVVCMAIGGASRRLDPARDALINVNAFGDPVPSARFMGGREFELLLGDRPRAYGAEDVARVVDSSVMLLPSVVAGSGPFPNLRGGWVGAEPEGAARFCAVSFYLALMTATCLELVGADGPVVVEGPFASNAVFQSMLAAATERPVVTGTSASTGTSIGAALLIGGSRAVGPSDMHFVEPADEGLRRYARMWRAKVGATA